jgi:hypothetical protein
MNSRILLSISILILGVSINPNIIKILFVTDRSLDLPSLVIGYFLSFFFVSSSLFIILLKKKIKFLNHSISVKNLFFYFLIISVTPLVFVSIESMLWFSNKFLGEPSSTADIIAQNEMKSRSKEIFVSDGITFPTKYSSKFFNINDNGFRTYDFRIKKENTRIAIIGGSTTYGINVADHNTIPGILEQMIEKSSTEKISVWNLGVSGINSFDELKVLKSTYKFIKPNFVVFYHGANDFANLYYKRNNNEEKSLIIRDNPKNRMYFILNQFQTISLMKMAIYFFNYKISKKEKEVYNNLNINLFIEQVKRISNFCDSVNISCFFFIQPLLETKNNLTFFEKKIFYERKFVFPKYGKLYNIFANQLLTDAEIDYIDLRNILNFKNKRLFYDYVHTTSKANKIIAQEILNSLVNRNVLKINSKPNF